MQYDAFDQRQLERFRAAQRDSFAVLEETASKLSPGMAERDATTSMLRAFQALGVRSYFHLPVALFGARTALPERWRLKDFWPTHTRLAEGDAVILDASPIIDGYLVDTSYSTRLGDNDEHHKMLMDLAPFRDFIAEQVRSGVSFMDIAIESDARIRALGYENRHQAHLEEVLGHRAARSTPDAGMDLQEGLRLIQDGKVYWLDDDTPHTRYWRRH